MVLLFSGQDIPTFTQKLTQLMQDAHCVHLNETA